MNWYALQVLTGTERDVCTALRRKGVKARAPDQRMEIRRRGQWQTEDRLLLPGCRISCRMGRTLCGWRLRQCSAWNPLRPLAPLLF